MEATPASNTPAMPENLAREAEQLTREIQVMLRNSQESIEHAQRLGRENQAKIAELEERLGCGIK